MTKKAKNIGLGQARVLCQMRQEERLAFLAEGLPLILASARDYWHAARQLKAMPREADVLCGLAVEEAAKVLILMDAVRCPKKLIASRMGKITRWFYDHLARLIYAEAVGWRPTNVAELRRYVDSSRESHTVDGDFGEYIFPNWNLFGRESQLYVDVLHEGDRDPYWSEPNRIPIDNFRLEPPVLRLAGVMSNLGLFSLQGLKATSQIWGQMTFTEHETFADAEGLTWQLLKRLSQENLVPEAATQDDPNYLVDEWQIPMYDFKLGLIEIPMEDLEATQEQILWGAIGEP